MTKLPSLALFALAACWSASQPTTPREGGAVDVQVASVSLADDCPDPVAAAPADKPSISSSSVACFEGHDCNASSRRRSCEQTTMQLALRSTGTGGAKIAIKRVELLDASGASLGTMAVRNPTRWTEAGEYVPWNEAIDARQEVTASYALSLPADHEVLDVSKTYRVRVTVSIGGEDRTLEKPATLSISAPAHLEPGVVT